MKTINKTLLVIIIGLLTLTACGTDPGRTVESYLQAIIAKDADAVSALSCADWEMDALLELDSFQAVETRLEGLSCTYTTEEDGSSSVACTGKILATYNGEEQEFDLSRRIYAVIEQGGDFLVCGYR